MESRNKFIEYMKNLLEEVEIEIAKEAIPLQIQSKSRGFMINDSIRKTAGKYIEIKRVIDMLNITKQNWEEYGQVNGNLEQLSKYLELSPLSAKEQVTIIMSEIKRNIDNGILTAEESFMLDLDIIEDYNLTIEEVKDLITNNAKLQLINKNEKDLTEKEIKQKQFLEKGVKELSGVDPYIDAHKKIKEHFFDKEQINSDNEVEANLSNKDIEVIITSLEELKIDSNLCKKIKYLLEKEQKKKNKKEETSRKINLVGKQEERIRRLTDKEYKQKKKAIKEYFDTYTGKLNKENLSEEEILYCAHLMLEIDTHKDIIKTFFSIAEQKQQHPIARYLQEYDRLKFYEEKLGLEESIKIMEESFQEIFISTKDDYEFWKNNIEQELDKLTHRIPRSYEYELEQAKHYNPSKVKQMK